MRKIITVILCVILLSNVFSIGSLQNLPNDSLIPFAYAIDDLEGQWIGTVKFSLKYYYGYPEGDVVCDYSSPVKVYINHNQNDNSVNGYVEYDNPPIGSHFCEYSSMKSFGGNEVLDGKLFGSGLEGTYGFSSITGSFTSDTFVGNFKGTWLDISGQIKLTKTGDTGTTKTIAQLVDDADNKVQNRQYQQALEVIDEILVQEPRNKRAVWLGGISHFELENYDSSIQFFRIYQTIEPTQWETYSYIADSFIGLEQYDDAVNILGEGISNTDSEGKKHLEEHRTLIYQLFLTVDSDNDGISDDVDECPTQSENFNGYRDHDGCPDTRPPQPKPVSGT